MLSFLKKRPQARGLVGIGIQPEGVAFACVQRDEGQTPQLLSCGFVPVNGSKSIAHALVDLSKSKGIKGLPVATSMAAGEFNLLLVEAPQVEEAELKAAVRWKIKEMIDYSTDEAAIDVFDIPGQQERGRTRMIYVVAARTADVQQRIEQIEQNGLALQFIDIPELVQRNIATLLPEDSAGVALLYLSPQGGLITLTHNATLYLARELDTSLDQLAGLGDQGGEDTEDVSVLSLEDMAPDQQRALDAIILEIQRSLDYYESHFSQPPINNLVIAPLAKEVPGMVSYIARNSGLQVRVLDLNSVLDMPQPLSSELQSRCLSAIGAALRHIGEAA